MDSPFAEKKFTFEKNLIYILIIVGVAVLAVVIYLFFSSAGGNIKLVNPNGFEEWQIGQTYKISWQAKGIDKVGIVLFKEKEPEWIAKDIDARLGQYEWKIYPGHKYGNGFWIAVFEYPWKEGNKIDYSNSAFAITFPELSGCEQLSLESERPYLPSDLPGLRRVFVTEGDYSGNLGGLEGAEKICQKEAKDQGFEGAWHAFLGGDSESELAFKRMENTPRKKEGIFSEAEPAAVLLRGATCHRLLGKDFNDFLKKLSSSLADNKEKLGEDFASDLENVWLGRLDQKSKNNCISIAEFLGRYYKPTLEKYSFTSTCQNWMRDQETIDGYPVPEGSLKPQFPSCYTLEGKSTEAVGLAGLGAGMKGKICSSKQKLICIEE